MSYVLFSRLQKYSFYTKYASFYKLKNIVKEVIRGERNIMENYEIHYSDGIRGMKKAKSLNGAISIANKLRQNKNMRFVDIYKADSGFHSTADEKYLVKWWGEDSYWGNKSKRDPELRKKCYRFFSI